MQQFMPGTTIEIRVLSEGMAENIFGNIFVGGGVVLSQVSAMTGLEPYVVQNWVKRGFVSPPIRRMYSKRQFSRIVVINMLRESMQLDRIVSLLSYINGRLDDESDDTIDDFALYCLYVDLLSRVGTFSIDREDIAAVVHEFLSSRTLSSGVDQKKLARVLELMVYAHFSATLRRRSDILFAEIAEDR